MFSRIVLRDDKPARELDAALLEEERLADLHRRDPNVEDDEAVGVLDRLAGTARDLVHDGDPRTSESNDLASAAQRPGDLQRRDVARGRHDDERIGRVDESLRPRQPRQRRNVGLDDRHPVPLVPRRRDHLLIDDLVSDDSKRHHVGLGHSDALTSAQSDRRDAMEFVTAVEEPNVLEAEHGLDRRRFLQVGGDHELSIRDSTDLVDGTSPRCSRAPRRQGSQAHDHLPLRRNRDAGVEPHSRRVSGQKRNGDPRR